MDVIAHKNAKCGLITSGSPYNSMFKEKEEKKPFMLTPKKLLLFS